MARLLKLSMPRTQIDRFCRREDALAVIKYISRYVLHPLRELKQGRILANELLRLERQQWWTFDALTKLQTVRLRRLLEHAYQSSAFYNQRFIQNGLSPQDMQSLEDLQFFPVTTKRDLRGHQDEFLSSRVRRENLFVSRTGGSVGVPLEVYSDKRTREFRNAAAIMADRWSGWDIGVMRAMVWGNPPKVQTAKQRLRRFWIERVFYLDTMNINEATLDAFVAQWRKSKPEALFGHSHSVYLLARYVHEQNIDDLRPRSIVTSAMMLLRHERALIEQVFSCKVTDRYGCEELGLIACECSEHKGMHINMSHVYLEILDENDQPLAPGRSGKITVTDLNNLAMPLIRYRIEDMGELSTRRCPCGRGLGLLEAIQGRVADFLKLPDGSLVAGVSLVERTLTKVPGIEQMQIVQDNLFRITVNRVKSADFTHESDAKLLAAMREVFDESVAIHIQSVPSIPQEDSGKYRFSICRI